MLYLGLIWPEDLRDLLFFFGLSPVKTKKKKKKKKVISLSGVLGICYYRPRFCELLNDGHIDLWDWKICAHCTCVGGLQTKFSEKDNTHTDNETK